MAKINMEQLLDAVNGLISDDSDDDQNTNASKNQNKNSDEERRKAQEVAEEAERKAEEERKAKAEEEKKAKAEQEKKEAEVAKQENRIIDSKLEAHFADSGFDKQSREALAEFVDYGTLKNDDGEADEEKIKSFIDAVSSVALRKPPRSKGKKIDHDNMGGIGKYLKIDI